MAILLALGGVLTVHAANQSDPDRAAADELREEVIARIQEQAIGGHSVADLRLPRGLLERIADREIRTTFEERFRIVVGEAAIAKASPPGQSRQEPASGGGWRVIVPQMSKDSSDRWKEFQDARPENRGFRVADLEVAHATAPQFAAPDRERISQARRIVATRLAADGLLATLAAVLPMLNVDASDPQGVPQLAGAGLPIDLIHHFRSRTRPTADVLAEIAAIAKAKKPDEPRIDWSEHFEFTWKPSDVGFQACLEDGSQRIAAARVQATRGDDWQAPGDGGNIDMLRNLVGTMSDIDWRISIQDSNLEAFKATADQWPWRRSQVTVTSQHVIVGQWAQDCGKPGFIANGDGQPRAAMLVPRFASRGDDGSTFIAGETLAALSASDSNCSVIASPLIFQGGNLLIVTEPNGGRRLLLVDEAEIARNTSLGLTSAQVMQAFAGEFGVDRVEVLASVSFHLDCDVTVRRQAGRSAAFVNDPVEAAWIMMECGANAMRAHGRLTEQGLNDARAAVESRDVWKYVNAAGGRVFAEADERGCFPLSLANEFSLGELDSGVGNLERYLVALDYLMAAAMADAQLPEDRVARGYMLAIKSTEISRDSLQTQLDALGFDVVAVPGFSDLRRSICPVNGLHDRGRYLMPAFGGLFAPLDDAARTAFAKNLGDDVRVELIRSAESQRRAGALHCSVATWTSP